MMIRKTLAAFAFAGTMAVLTPCATAQTPPPPPPAMAKVQASAYVMAAGRSDLYEINSSQIAVKKSTSPQVRAFANMLIKHHQQTTAATMKAAAKAGLTPAAPSLDAGAAASIRELQTASAADFDRVYLAQQVPAHEAALDLHQSYAKGGDQAPLRTSAKAAIPIVKQHLDAAKRLHSNGGGGHSGHGNK